MDVCLAEGNGVSAVERITRAGPVPHLFISGYDPHAVPLHAEVLRKPFREAGLVAAIGRALGTPGPLGPEPGPLPQALPPVSSTGPAPGWFPRPLPEPPRT